VVTSHSPLITASELAESLRSQRPSCLIDVRWQLTGPPGVDAYRAGHIPGAVYADLDNDLSDPPGDRGRHPLPDADRFARRMRALGVNRATQVVAYDPGDSTIAARLWWMLRYFGHPDVRVLDGGYRLWLEETGLVAYGDEAPPTAGDFQAMPGGMPLLTVDEVPGFTRRGLLLDARAAERYRGETEPLDPVAGHIPGARSAPTFDNVRADGRFRPPSELAKRFADLGVGAATEVGVYCGSGVTAAHEVLALRLAGRDAALYVGSWSEWLRDPQRGVATGALETTPGAE
jgi:thiosulfate/3-mercaptopyruvate sulfurtransferase